MWELSVFGSSLTSFKKSSFFIPPDDLVFTAAIKRGPTVHIGKKTSVRCIHVAEWENNSVLVFSATLLEASSIEARHPQFGEDGIMGKWLLSISTGDNEAKLKFLSLYDTTENFLEDVLSYDNPIWIRRGYECANNYVLKTV